MIAYNRGQYALAKAYLLAAIGRLEELIRESPDRRALRNDLSLAYNNLAIIYHQGLLPGGNPEPLYRKAIALKDPLADQTPDDPQLAEGGAAYAYNLSMWLQGQRRFKEAAELQRQIEDRYLKLAAAHPQETRWQDRLATVWQGMAFIQERLTNYTAACEANQRALGTIERLLEGDPASLALQSRRAELQVNYANTLAESGNLAKAEDTYRQSLHSRQALIAKDPENAHWRSLLADAWSGLATVLDQEGRHEEASDARTKALQTDTVLKR
jgi:hypothetical protein